MPELPARHLREDARQPALISRAEGIPRFSHLSSALTLCSALVDSQQIATTYLRYFETKQETDIWAIDEVDTLVLRDPEKGWEITRTLVNKALTEEALAYVAAGPLEDLLNHHGAAVMVQIEQECLTNDRFRLALSGV